MDVETDCTALPNGPPVHKRPLPGLPPATAENNMQITNMDAPIPPKRTESKEKWEPMNTSSSQSKTGKRARPVITVLDARPMSEVGFRESGGSMPLAPPPSVPEPSSPLGMNQPDVTNRESSAALPQQVSVRPSVKRPPPPTRPPGFRKSTSSIDQQNTENEIADKYDSKPLPEPPRVPGKPPRPLSMLAKLPSPLLPGKSSERDGIENEGFEARNNRLNSLERDCKEQSLIDFDSDVFTTEPANDTSTNKDVAAVPDLLSDNPNHIHEPEQQNNCDLVSDVHNGIMDRGVNKEIYARGVSVLPISVHPRFGNKQTPGIGGGNPLPHSSRGPPPPLPKKSPSVPNLNKLNGDATWNSLGVLNKRGTDDDSDRMNASDVTDNAKIPAPRMKPPRKPTIIRPGVSSSLSSSYSSQKANDKTPSQNDSNQSSANDPKAQNEINDKTVASRDKVAGGVQVFPFIFPKSLPKSHSDHSSLSSSSHSDIKSESSATSESNITSKSKQHQPPPMVKPKPSLMPKPSLGPKPNVAPKPKKGSQISGMSQFTVVTGSAPKKKEPWQNELNDILAAKRKQHHTSPVSDSDNQTKQSAEDEWDQPPSSIVSGKKPGPMKATYRPTIIRAAVTSAKPKEPKETLHHQQTVSITTTTTTTKTTTAAPKPASRESSPSLSKRFSTSCYDMRSSGSEEHETNNNLTAKDDLFTHEKSFNDKPTSPTVRKRQRPTVIRPRSVININRVADSDDMQQKVDDRRDINANKTTLPDLVGDTNQIKSLPPPRPGLPSAVVLRRASIGEDNAAERSPKQLTSPTVKSPPANHGPVPMRRHSKNEDEEQKSPTATSPTVKSQPVKAKPPRPSSGPVRKNNSYRLAPPKASNRKSMAEIPLGNTTPHGLALFTYQAQQEGDISFQEGDTIELVKEVDADWLVGRCHGIEGMFPSNFVNVIVPFSSTAPQDVQSPPPSDVQPQQEQVQAASINTFDTADTHIQEQPNVTQELSGPRCKAIHDYLSPEANDLSFKAGTIITLLENCGGEWYRGELYGVSGMFPATFVEIVEDLPVESYKKPEQTDSVYLKESDSVQNERVEERSEFSHRVEEDHVIKDEYHVPTLYDFNGEDGELTFKANEIVHIISRVNDDWLFGEVDGKRGNFPVAFIAEVPPNLPDYTVQLDNMQDTAEQQQHPSINTPNTESYLEEATTPHINTDAYPETKIHEPSTLQMGVVLYDFVGETEEDLALNVGDSVEIIEAVGDEWLRGRIGGREGLFPASFVEVDC